MNTSECNQSPSSLTTPPSESERGDALASVLRALGAGPCKTTSAAGGAVILEPPGFGGGAVSTAVGCDQIDVVVDSVVAAQRNLNCLVREIVQAQGVVVKTRQVITLVINNMDLVKNINIQQASNDQIVLLTYLNDTDKLNIADQLKQFNTDFFSSLQDSKTGYLHSAQGQKSISDFRKTFSQENINQVIQKTISTIEQNVDTDQEIKVEINGYDPMSVRYHELDSINISQDSYVLIKSSQILNTFLDAVFKTDEGQTLKQDITKGMKNESKGLESIIPNIFGAGIIILAIIAGGVFIFGGAVSKYILPISLIASVAGSIYFGLEKPPKIVYSIIAGIIGLLSLGLEIVALKNKSR